MFDALEQKLLVDTLTKRCAWLSKTISDGNLDEKAINEHKAMLRVLSSATKKIEKLTPVISLPPSSPPGPPKKRQKHSIPLTDAHILIAEDDPDSAMLLEGILEDIGLKHISIARDGREAVNMLKNASPSYDIVLSDWDMPELNGLEVRRQVRNLARLQDTHFIMVTAVSEAARIKEAIGEGITDYVVKPVDASILEKKVKAALAGVNTPSEV
jgi:two-component system chemotaxis response regulator CheY